MRKAFLATALIVAASFSALLAQQGNPLTSSPPPPVAKVYAPWPFDAREAIKRQDETAKALGIEKELTLDLGNNVKMKLVLIPAGKFMMGSPAGEADRHANEGPQHEVTISKPFYMGVTEVTQEQYEQVMGKNPSHFKGAQNPVESVSWNDAAEFCRKLSKRTGQAVRLPTEAEWEYACRAGAGTRYCFGDAEAELGDYAWHHDNSEGTTHPVGQKKPNVWGLYDMHGNVMEWCADWYSDSYANAASQDPQGPGTGSSRVCRGCYGIFPPAYHRSAVRSRHPSDYVSIGIGFRVALAPPHATLPPTSAE
ncbi:MAG: formylglycine-generating enzyme family protein [Phycisphaerae bacterium]|jgi:formylglycine-generating enzyme required for sulfatase activity